MVVDIAEAFRPAVERWIAERTSSVPLAIVSWQGEVVSLLIPGAPACLEVCAGPRGLCVAVDYDGEQIDQVFCPDVSPTVTPEGVVCTCCSEPRREFASLFELWQDHLFGPLDAWLVDVYAPAACLVIARRGGASWATLAADERKPAEGEIVIPLGARPAAGSPAAEHIVQAALAARSGSVQGPG